MQVPRGPGLTKQQRNNTPSNAPIVNLACMRSKLNYQIESVLFWLLRYKWHCVIFALSGFGRALLVLGNVWKWYRQTE